ncbi:transcriptional regulator [Aquisalimonas sp. 2447]|uniref:P-II family nitrogen regulator n=1 Tax=Aquisalimonas sp. 2447 TaxID=2740807 RepID=UPI001432346B|nr:transcriptional regulator [Aquisalimonas sp. 2447]QIT54723.1 transcriptional regulator [Aquisalimonas sp. 2447]
MNRKLLTVITEQALERQLVRCAMEAGARGYTITEARGQGERGLRSADFETGGNIRLEVICEEAVARQISTRLHRDYFEDFAMVLYLEDVEVLRPEKFDAPDDR